MKIWLFSAFTLFLAVDQAQATCQAGNCRDGEGRATFSNGDRYVGQWSRGQMHGQGIYTYTSGPVYRGAFERGKLSGRGTMRYPDGAYYAGEWRNNRKHGEGKLVKPSGKTTTGRWVNGKLSSRSSALASNTNRTRLRDCNVQTCYEGRGRYTYRDGAVYEGDFEEGQPSGDGRVVYASGDIYEGGWHANAPDGEGTYSFANGKKISGKWSNGKLIQRAYAKTQPARPSNSASRPTARPARNTAGDGKSEMYAVVVGIGAYDAMQTLRFTDDDAYQMYAFLKSPEGGALTDKQVEVLIDEDATKRNIEQALQRKLALADADDIVVFFYSGHGVDGYFVPVDFDGVNNLLSHDRVEQLLSASAAKHKLVLADACHSGGLLAAKSMHASTTRLYDAFAKSRGGTALLLSSKSTEVSLEANNLRSGVFSHFLMRGLRGEADADRNAVVTVNELHDFLYRNVRSYTGKRQTPVLTGDFDERMPVAVLR